MKLISIVVPYIYDAEDLLFWNQLRSDTEQVLEFPGGKIEDGETPIQAAVREVFEETGVELNLEELQLFKCYEFNEGLNIYVFLSMDKFRQFSKDGFKPSRFYTENLDKILPNNKIIFNELVSYLQDVRPFVGPKVSLKGHD